MSEKNAVIAIYPNHSEAEDALKELQKSGFDMKKLSIVGKDYHSDKPGEDKMENLPEEWEREDRAMEGRKPDLGEIDRDPSEL